MPSITVRKIDSALLKGFKARASKNGKSLEEEIRATLERALDLDRLQRQRQLQKAFAIADALAKKTGPIKKGSSLKIIRAYRDSALSKKSKA